MPELILKLARLLLVDANLFKAIVYVLVKLVSSAWTSNWISVIFVISILSNDVGVFRVAPATNVGVKLTFVIPDGISSVYPNSLSLVNVVPLFEVKLVILASFNFRRIFIVYLLEVIPSWAVTLISKVLSPGFKFLIPSPVTVAPDSPIASISMLVLL